MAVMAGIIEKYLYLHKKEDTKMTVYKGYTINKVFKYGYYYYRISGEKQLYSRLKDAKAEIDKR